MFLCLDVAPHNTAYKKAQQPHNSLGQNSFFYLDFLLRYPYEFNPKVTALPVQNPIQYRNLDRFVFFSSKKPNAHILYRDTKRIVDYALAKRTQIGKYGKIKNKKATRTSLECLQLMTNRIANACIRETKAHSSACHDEESSS